MPDDLAALAMDEGPGAFVPRKELASPDALVRLETAAAADREALERFYGGVSEVRPKADPKKKARRRAARASRRRNRRA